MKSTSLIKLSGKEFLKITPLNKFEAIPKELKDKKKGLAFPKEFTAAVLTDKKGSPIGFVFDTYSFWDLLCVVDERFEKTASNEEYFNNNPVGWLIDAIEAHLPLNPKLTAKLKKNIEEAKTSGLIPLSEIKHKLGLA